MSKDFYEIADNNIFWKNLFKNIFANNVPAGMLGKKALNSNIIRTQDELLKIAEAFFCRLKWGQKTRLECFFPDKTPPTVVELSFALLHEGEFKSYTEFRSSRANQIDCHIFLGDVNSLKKAAHIQKEIRSFGIGNLPCYEWIDSIFLLKAGNEIQNLFTPDRVEVEGVDVGYGNTLGYCSSINGWKEPFELFCVSGNDGQKVWSGPVPSNAEIKFVKIDPSGNITWENLVGNRRFSSSWWWYTFLARQPISFS